MPAKLLYKDAEGNECEQLLNGKVFRLGRLKENDLSFENPYISRVHAEIVFKGDHYVIRDLDSTSGTFVNFERVKERRLTDGDRVRLGRGRGIEFLFRAEAGASAGADPATEPNGGLHPVRVMSPEEARFVNTEKLSKETLVADRTVDWLRSLYEFTSQSMTAHSSIDLCEKLASALQRTLGAQRVAVLLFNRERGELETVVTLPDDSSMTPSSSITRLVYADDVAVLSFDASSDARFARGKSVQLQAIRSAMAAPISSKTRRWGVCYVDHLTSDRAFGDEELEYLTGMARQAGVAMENIFLLDEQRRSLESFIRTLAASLDARDDTTAGHSARVGAYSMGIARRMGMSPAEARVIYYAGLLHDYGKIGIRDDVLLKPASLTPEEFEHIKQHPQHTYRLLSKIRLPEEIADIPLVAASHHERYDGTGYPQGLKGEEIPIGARIVAVADAFDALVEERAYSEPLPIEEALAELVARSGTHFDPAVIVAFQEYFETEIKPRHRRRARSTQSSDLEDAITLKEGMPALQSV